MATQLDWIGPTGEEFERGQPGFVGPIRRRQSVRDEKEELRAQLRPLVERFPPRLNSSGVIETRRWLAEQKTALRVLKSERSSVHDLTSAINNMSRFL